MESSSIFSPLFYTVVCAISIVAAIVINRIFIRLGSSRFTNAHAGKDLVRWAKQTKPTAGGVSFYFIFLMGIVLATILPTDGPALITDYKPFGLVAACSLGFILGFVDDAFHIGPLFKIMGQIACAYVLYFSGFSIDVSGSTFFNFIFTLVWVVAIMNSINMIDNMDGISTILSISICIICLMVAFFMGQQVNIYTLLIIMVVGALLGFLSLNWNPSEIIMGDTGSQFLGVFLSGISMLFLWQFKPNPPTQFIHFKQFLLPLLAFMLPFIDTITVFVRRIAIKKSPFQGGRDHTTHHLAFYGLNDRQVALTFASFSLVSIALAGICIENFANWKAIYTVGIFIYFLGVLGSIQVIYYLNWQRKKSAAKTKTGVIKSINDGQKTAK